MAYYDWKVARISAFLLKKSLVLKEIKLSSLQKMNFCCTCSYYHVFRLITHGTLCLGCVCVTEV